MSAFRRLATGGVIDRNQPISFSYNGKKLRGFAGDTLASALLANGELLLGRSFKYHRPRGILSAGEEEPNALFTLNRGGVNEPNMPATIVPLQEGLHASTQNAWPSVHHDVGSINSLLGPLLQSGFYYKTFMGPFKKSWMFYEPFIRRAAGLGTVTDARDPDRYDMAYEFCDVLVVGAGPAGMAAALQAAAAGATVTLVEQESQPGGQLRDDALSAGLLAELQQAVLAQPNITCHLNTVAQGVYDSNLVVLQKFMRSPHATAARQSLILLTARNIIFATGAVERPLLFGNNDVPGIMLASALRTYHQRFALVPHQRCVLATNNNSVYATAFALAEAGVAVTVVDERQNIAANLLSRAAMLGIALFPNSQVAYAEAGKVLKKIHLAGAHGASLMCDVLGMSGGWSPALHLTSHGGSKPVHDQKIAAFVPGSQPRSHFIAGAVAGHFSTLKALSDGQQAADKAVQLLQLGPAPAPPLPGFKEEPYDIQAQWSQQLPAKGKAFVDFQNDVTTKDIKIAWQEGYESVEHLKRYTTSGMGTDQGKTSNINALALMAGWRGLAIAQAGTTTFRPPYTGLTLGAIAGRAIKRHVRPIRYSPLHERNVAHGAAFIEAGPWLRAWYYKWAGDSAETAYVKEMALVRAGVGLADVSTLGKIDVQGPDAAEFLNRIYVNGFAKLPVGRARYGVMLNDDGVVLDDGTTTHIAEHQFYMTTTTAQGGEVMSWLEFLLQMHWQDLRVHVTSLTDEWGAMALSGPLSRQALQLAFPDVDVTNEKLPYMGCLECVFKGVPVRLIRLSFSGELAYEIHLPADYAASLWEHILHAAAPLGIKPYGLEALASLRIEKGHVAGLELDHRNTLDDLGLGKMAGKDKDYVGKALRFRPNLQAEERWSLVGLEPVEEGAKFRGGAILFSLNDEIKGHGRGYITSVTWSTELGKYIALALYDGGLKHEGEEIICAFPLKDETMRARIVSPVFIDKTGARLHA